MLHLRRDVSQVDRHALRQLAREFRHLEPGETGSCPSSHLPSRLASSTRTQPLLRLRFALPNFSWSGVS